MLTIETLSIANKAAAGPIIALCLGLVGAVVYVMLLPNGRLNIHAGIDAENRANNAHFLA